VSKEHDALVEGLYAQYYDAVYLRCLSIIQYNPRFYPLVEDCVQEAFLQVVEDDKKFKRCKNPVGWIVRVAQNKLKGKFRDEICHAKVISPLLFEQQEDMAFSIYSLDQELSRRDAVEAIARIYHQLSDMEKKVFIAYFLHDLDQKETAKETNLTENSVRAAVKRIRRRARAMKTENFLFLLGAFLISCATRK